MPMLVPPSPKGWREAADRAARGFIVSTLRAANTLADIGLTTVNEEKRTRSGAKALQAYLAVQRFLPGVVFTPEDENGVKEQLDNLQQTLRSLGLLP